MHGKRYSSTRIRACCVALILFSAKTTLAQSNPGGAHAKRFVEASSSAEPAKSPAAGGAIKAFDAVSSSDATLVVVREQSLRAAALQGGKVVLDGLALEAGQPVSLELEPLRVGSLKTKVVVGRAGGVDEPFPFDFSSVQLFHGKVQGHPGSEVVLFSSPRGVRGHIDLGRTGQRYLLSTVASDGQTAGSLLAEVRPVSRSADRLPDVPMCGRDAVSLPDESGSVAGCSFEPSPGVVYHKRLAVAEIAIETDYELYANFNDLTLTTDYLIDHRPRRRSDYPDHQAARRQRGCRGSNRLS